MSDPMTTSALNTDWKSQRMPEGPKRPYLVIVRTGSSSLHTKWPKIVEGGERNWDLLLSHFDEHSEPIDPDADIIVKQGAFKYGACYRLFTDIAWLKSYKAVWFCDDDIMTSWADINRLFDLFTSFNLALAQPALTANSFINHPICAQKPNNLMRYTNFVEIMVPVLSQEALEIVLPTFHGAVTGWGLDFVWPHLLGPDPRKVAIVDAVAVHHTRQGATGAIYVQAKEAKVQPHDEMRSNLAQYHVKTTAMVEYGVIFDKPKSNDAQRGDLLEAFKEFIMKTLMARPSGWETYPDGYSLPEDWMGGSVRTLTTPPFRSTDVALSFGLTLNLFDQGTANGQVILDLQESEVDHRIAILVVPSDEGHFRLALQLFHSDRRAQLIGLSNLPYGESVRVAFQVVPRNGWIRCWINDKRQGDALVNSYEWGTAGRIKLGCEGLHAALMQVWVRSFGFKMDF